MDYFEHDQLKFAYREQGAGTPFVFQHGLGSNTQQPFQIAATLRRVRLLGMDCRAHGDTFPLGPPAKISLSQSADDLLALLDELMIERAVIGGISMGAAIALTLVIRHSERALALVVSRPAWLDQPAPANLDQFSVIASLLRAYGPEKGLDEFRRSAAYRQLERDHPASAESLAGQFVEPRAVEAVVRLERIPNDVPTADRRDWARIAVPTLVLGNSDDPIHPLAYAMQIADAIPGAAFAELTPKGVSPERHAADATLAISDFLNVVGS